jgi:hypothetical protein
MSPGEIIALVVACLTALGLTGTWVKNNHQDRDQRTRMETNLKNEIKEVKDDVKHPEYGLSAIKKAQQEMQVNCARTTSNFGARIDSLEDKVNKTESRRRKKSS